MKVEIVLTCSESDQIADQIVGHTNVYDNSDLRVVMSDLAKTFFAGGKWRVREDEYIFKYIVVNERGDTLTLR